MKNRGQISIVILVIGIFVVCALALFSFFMSSSYVKNSFIGTSLMTKMNIDIENYFVDPNSVETTFNAQGQKVLYEEKLGRNKFVFGSKDILFSVEYVLE